MGLEITGGPGTLTWEVQSKSQQHSPLKFPTPGRTRATSQGETPPPTSTRNKEPCPEALCGLFVQRTKLKFQGPLTSIVIQILVVEGGAGVCAHPPWAAQGKKQRGGPKGRVGCNLRAPALLPCLELCVSRGVFARVRARHADRVSPLGQVQ